MAIAVECPICLVPIALKSKSKFYPDGGYFTCPKCGDYHISMEAKVDLKSQFYDKRFILAGVTRNATEAGKEHIIDSSNLQELISNAPRFENALMRLDHLLLYMSRHEGVLTGPIVFDINNDYSIIYAKDSKEFGYIHRLGVTLQQLEPTKSVGVYGIAPAGWRRIQELQKEGANSRTVFVAMWFGEKTKKLRKSITSAIKSAGYTAIIADEGEFTGDIMDFVTGSIKQSKFVIADFTTSQETEKGGKILGGVRGGVYYEAGFAKGYDLEVIHLCKDDEDSKDRVHFDIKQLNTIFWTDKDLESTKVRKTEDRQTNPAPRNLSEKLYDRIISIFGEGSSS